MSFDSREYEWADLNLVLGGRDITRFRGIKYTEKIEREPLYAKGRNPIAIQSGNASVEGEVTLLQSEVQALINAGNGSVLSLSLDATITYGNPPDPQVSNRVLGLRFTESPKEMKQGDKFMEITLPFVALRVVNQ
jgi:hypothetical protein